MPVSRTQIAKLVIEKLKAVSHTKDEIDEDDRLWQDLGMGPIVRQAMAMPYSRITAEHGGVPVTPSAAGKLKTVGESIDLVHKRASAGAGQ